MATRCTRGSGKIGSSLFSVGRDTEFGSSEVKHGDEVVG
jgi:hypothetical protein